MCWSCNKTQVDYCALSHPTPLESIYRSYKMPCCREIHISTLMFMLKPQVLCFPRTISVIFLIRRFQLELSESGKSHIVALRHSHDSLDCVWSLFKWLFSPSFRDSQSVEWEKVEKRTKRTTSCASSCSPASRVDVDNKKIVDFRSVVEGSTIFLCLESCSFWFVCSLALPRRKNQINSYKSRRSAGCLRGTFSI